MERVPLELEARTPGRSSAARALRRSGKIPGILYGAGREPSAFAVATTVLREALTGEGGRHAILDVKVPGERAAIPAILKEFQLDPIRDRVTHVDLLAIRLDEPIETNTSVVLIGEPRGVKFEGGVLEQPTHEISILGLPASLVDHVEVDVSELGVGDSLKLADVTAPEGLSLHRRSRSRARDRHQLVACRPAGGRGRRGRGGRGRGARGARPSPRPSRPRVVPATHDASWTFSLPDSATPVGATAPRVTTWGSASPSCSPRAMAHRPSARSMEGCCRRCACPRARRWRCSARRST